MRMLYYRFFCLFILILMIGTSVASLKKRSEFRLTHRGNRFNFGVVPQFKRRDSFKICYPIFLELENCTGLYFVFKNSPIIIAFERQFMSGGNLAFKTPCHFFLASSRQCYIDLVRNGGELSNDVLLAQHVSPVHSMEQLLGKTIAFPATHASDDSSLSRNELQNNYNISFIPKYVQTHRSVHLHMLKNLVDSDSGGVKILDSQKPSIRNNLYIIFQTRPILPQPITEHLRVSVECIELVKKAFLDMAQSESHKKLLAKIPIKKAAATLIADFRNILSWKLEVLCVP